MTSGKAKGLSEPGIEIPPYHKELARRITAVADRFETRKSAAEAAGVSTDQLARYMRGENEPSFPVAARLAERAGVSLRWLATGEGEMELADERGREEIELAKRASTGLPISSWIRSGDRDHRFLRETLVKWLRFKPEQHEPNKAEEEADMIIEVYLGRLAREAKDL